MQMDQTQPPKNNSPNAKAQQQHQMRSNKQDVSIASQSQNTSQIAQTAYQRTKTAIKNAERMEINKFLAEENEDTEFKMTSNNTDPDNAAQNIQNMRKVKDPIQQFLRQVPPDFNKAEIHGAGSHFPLCTDIKELYPLGPGYPMYYALKKNLTWLLFILAIICGIPCTILSGIQTLKKSGYDISSYPYMSKISIGNVFELKQMFSDDALIVFADVIVYLNAAGIVYLLIHSIWLRKMLIQTNNDLDQDVVSPSDFTIVAKHLPKNLTPDQFKEKFEKQFSKYGIKVAYVNYAYNIEKMYACNKELMTLSRQKAMFKLHLRKFMQDRGLTRDKIQQDRSIEVPPLRIQTGICKSYTITLEQINKSIEKAQKEMIDFEQNLAPGSKEDLYIGTAFIVLQTQRDQQTLINLYDDSIWTRLTQWISNKFCSCCGDQEKVTAENRFQRAPEPTDVYWDNLNIGFFERVRKILKTYFATILLVGACFGIIYGINVGKDKLNNSSDSISDRTIRFLSILCSFIIVFTNICLRTVIRAFTQTEKHETYTAYNLSVAFKLTFARFINTSIVPIVVNVATSRWFVDGGLVSDIFYIMISISFLDPILYALDPFYAIRLFKRFRARRQGKDSIMNQEEANLLWEGPPLDMANRYSNTANLFLTAIFFHPLLPISIPIAMVGFIFSYWIDKSLLLRRHKIPEQMSGLMAKFIANLLPYFAFLWSLNLLLFYRTLYKEYYEDDPRQKLIVPYAIIGLTSFFIILPVRTIINRCLADNTEDALTYKYDDFMLQFPTDYDRENPVTKNEAFIKLLEHRIQKEKNSVEQDKLLLQKNQLTNASVFDAVRAYSNKREAMKQQMQQHSLPGFSQGQPQAQQGNLGQAMMRAYNFNTAQVQINQDPTQALRQGVSQYYQQYSQGQVYNGAYGGGAYDYYSQPQQYDPYGYYNNYNASNAYGQNYNPAIAAPASVYDNVYDPYARAAGATASSNYNNQYPASQSSHPRTTVKVKEDLHKEKNPKNLKKKKDNSSDSDKKKKHHGKKHQQNVKVNDSQLAINQSAVRTSQEQQNNSYTAQNTNNQYPNLNGNPVAYDQYSQATGGVGGYGNNNYSQQATYDYNQNVPAAQQQQYNDAAYQQQQQYTAAQQQQYTAAQQQQYAAQGYGQQYNAQYQQQQYPNQGYY
eukprot:403336874